MQHTPTVDQSVIVWHHGWCAPDSVGGSAAAVDERGGAAAAETNRVNRVVPSGGSELAALFTATWVGAPGANLAVPQEHGSQHRTPASGSQSDDSHDRGGTLQLFESPAKRPTTSRSDSGSVTRHVWQWPVPPPDPERTALRPSDRHGPREAHEAHEASDSVVAERFCPTYVGESTGSASMGSVLTITPLPAALHCAPLHERADTPPRPPPRSPLPPPPGPCSANELWTDFSRTDRVGVGGGGGATGGKKAEKVWPGAYPRAATQGGTARHRRVRVVVPGRRRDDHSISMLRARLKVALSGMYMVTMQVVYLSDSERTSGVVVPYPCCDPAERSTPAPTTPAGAPQCDGKRCQSYPGGHVWCQESQVAAVLARLRAADLTPTTCVARGDGHIPLARYTETAASS